MRPLTLVSFAQPTSLSRAVAFFCSSSRACFSSSLVITPFCSRISPRSLAYPLPAGSSSAAASTAYTPALMPSPLISASPPFSSCFAGPNVRLLWSLTG